MMKGTLRWMVVMMMAITVFGYAAEGRAPAVTADDQAIVTEALDASITAERIGRYALYSIYEIDSTESRIKLTTAMATLGLSLKQLAIKLQGAEIAKNMPWIETSYKDLEALLHTQYSKDDLILIEDYVTLISQGMQKIARSFTNAQMHLRRYYMVIDIERSLRFYMIYRSEALKYEYMEEALCDTIARLDDRIAELGDLWGQEDSRYLQISNEWGDIEEIYADRDEGDLIPEAIELSEYLSSSI